MMETIVERISSAYAPEATILGSSAQAPIL
jgi:hypothetical protein